LPCLALPRLILSCLTLFCLVLSCVALSCLCLCIVVFVLSEILCSLASPIFVTSFLAGSDPHPFIHCLLLYFESDPNVPYPNPNPNPLHLQTLSSMAWSLNLQMGQSDVMRLKVISNEITFLVLCQSCVLVLCDLTSSEPAADARSLLPLYS
jgi:hypothetical protein